MRTMSLSVLGSLALIAGLVFLINTSPPKNTPDSKTALIVAIATVESQRDAKAYNPNEDAAGILQIRPIMVADVNRILGEQRYTLEDRWDPQKSAEMFMVYTDHYTPSWDPELVARRWNGGPKGDKKRSTLAYWDKVKQVF